MTIPERDDKDQNAKDWLNGLGEQDREDGNHCPDCGGEMDWCESCAMWTQTCCNEYGTCQCN